MRTHVLGQAKHPLLALFGHKLTQGKKSAADRKARSSFCRDNVLNLYSHQSTRHLFASAKDFLRHRYHLPIDMTDGFCPNSISPQRRGD
jgi:hypothetical protein